MSTQRGRSRKKMKNTYKPRIIALACLLVLAISAAIGGGLAKYTQQVKSEGTGAAFEAGLFEKESGSFKLEELKNIMGTDGAYDMENTKVTGNTYFMIPGTQIVKYPFISYENKTDIPAYMYLEVSGSEKDENVFEYGIAAGWQKILNTDGTTTNLDADVRGIYVLLDGEKPAVLDKNTPVAAGIPILNDKANTAAVDILSLQKLAENKEISFTAYALQAPNPKETLADAKAVWDRMDGGSKYLVDTTIKLTNTFKPGTVSAHIEEEFDGTTKSSVKIQNTGNVPAYLRAKVVVNWLDDNGYILANPIGVTDPAEGKIDTENWQLLNDGYYYYKGYVAAGDSKPLFTGSVTLTEGCQVEIIAEAIQATGFVNPLQPGSETAVHNAWKHDFVAGAWTES